MGRELLREQGLAAADGHRPAAEGGGPAVLPAAGRRQVLSVIFCVGGCLSVLLDASVV